MASLASAAELVAACAIVSAGHVYVVVEQIIAAGAEKRVRLEWSGAAAETDGSVSTRNMLPVPSMHRHFRLCDHSP